MSCIKILTPCIKDDPVNISVSSVLLFFASVNPRHCSPNLVKHGHADLSLQTCVSYVSITIKGDLIQAKCNQ